MNSLRSFESFGFFTIIIGPKYPEKTSLFFGREPNKKEGDTVSNNFLFLSKLYDIICSFLLQKLINNLASLKHILK